MAHLVSKKLLPYQGTVHDLTVSNTHSYNIEGLAVHNSAGGSLVAWALRITQLDPIKYGLLFERFLNEGRAGQPVLFTEQLKHQINHIKQGHAGCNCA